MISEKRHSLAHLLGDAIIKMRPEAKLTIGPAVNEGFYYDADLGSKPLSSDDLIELANIMKATLPTWSTFAKKVITLEEARTLFANNQYKLELIEAIAASGEEITTYTSGDFVDLCRGGHVEHMKEIEADSWILDRLSGAYWRGDENNAMLTRIYGIAFDTKAELDTYLEAREEAKKRDHRKLGKEMGLFVFSDLVGSGLPLFTQKGTYIRSKISDFSRELNAKIDFEEVHTPQIAKGELFKTSGHYDKYKEDMFLVTSNYSKEEFFLKPMNCPQHTQIYASEPRSYRDLPVRLADFAMLYRDERPGELHGLARTRAFAQDDGHAFVRPDQVKQECLRILSVIKEALETYGLAYHVRFSTHDPAEREKYLGSDELWNNAERQLKEIIEEEQIPYVMGVGEAAFYGPKIDIMATDALGRTFQISTVQLDYNQPERFDLTYKDSDGTSKRPVMIHRALVGSAERFMSIIIEHYGGAFPLWMSPSHVSIIPVAEVHESYAYEVLANLKASGIKASISTGDSVGKRIRAAKVSKTPYALVIGDKEVASKQIIAEVRGKDEKVTFETIDVFIEHIKTIITAKSREL